MGQGCCWQLWTVGMGKEGCRLRGCSGNLFVGNTVLDGA